MVKKITWLIVVRIVLVTLFLSVGSLVFKIDRSFFYFLIAGVYFLSLLYIGWLLTKRMLRPLVIAQLILDCCLISIIVLYTGSSESIFTTLYIVPILASSIIFSPLEGMIATALASMLYLTQLIVGFHNLIPFIHVKKYTVDLSMVIYTAHVHVVTFLLAGILSTALSRKIHQMEQKIQEKERTSLMGELAAQIAHEIRNPLATISGSIEILEEELRTQLETKNLNLMKAIVSESERVSTIFEQFLDFSKLDQLEYRKVDLVAVLEEICMLLEKRKLSQTVTIQKEFPQEPLYCECDPNRMKQVFWNILLNAYEAMADGGTIRLLLKTEKNMVCIQCSDSGEGMARRVKETLFLPFKSTKQRGIGLGLVVAHKIVERHGGRIGVESQKSKGTTFTVTIPQKKVL